MVRYSPRAAATSPAVMAIGAAVILVAVGLGAVWPAQSAPPAGVTRVYYIAADPVLWNYTPSGMNEITGEPFGVGNATELVYTIRNATYLGTTFMKCQYRQYANANFTALLPRPPSQAYLGLLGPVIYAAVGDTIEVTFRNNCPYPESISPTGVEVTVGSQGINYNGSVGASGGAAVPTGGTYQYTWQVPPSAGPGNDGESSTMWLYESGTNESNSTDTGLLGPMIISAQGQDNPNGTPVGVASNIIVIFNIYTETNSPFLRYNVDHFAWDPAAVNPTDPNWIESLNKYSMNGYLYGNMPMIDIGKGTHVRWYIGGAGGDMHSPHWHGNTVICDGMRTDVLTIIPGITLTADMYPDDAGVWLFHCHVDDHLAGGMINRYDVLNATSTPAATSGASEAASYAAAMFGGAPSPAAATSVDPCPT